MGKMSLGTLATVGAVYLFYDPLAPNWEITETRIDDRIFHLSLEMKRFNTGGDGDALMIVKRRARQLQQLAGMGSYKIQSLDQRIDSQTIGARRYAEAVVVLLPEFVSPPLPLPLEILPAGVTATPKSSAAKKKLKTVKPKLKDPVAEAVSTADDKAKN
jgi:hypothetical protein